MPIGRIFAAHEPHLQRLKHFPKGHLALVAGISLALFVGLALMPADDASAYRNDTLFLSPPANEPPERIELTLDIPEPRSTAVFLDEDSFEPEPDWHSEKVRRGDSMAKIFNRLRLSTTELDDIMDLGGETSVLRSLRPGQVVQVSRDASGNLDTLRFSLNHADTLVVRREGDAFHAETLSRPVESRLGFGCGVIDSSLFLAGQRAGLSDPQIMQLADIFEYDIDFHQELRDGDSFCVVYEERYIDGEKVGNGPIAAAEFVNQGVRYSAVRYTDKEGSTSYYADNGLALKKAFLRAPLKFTRISSEFNPRRRHPILNTIRAHKGTDYAAPSGTPIYAPSNGVVKLAGKQRGYGNVIMLTHGTKYSTKYGHLSRFAKGLKAGQKVKQGDVIGYVGQTGLASGPHLHYEFLVNGSHKNPRTVELPKAEPVPARERERFFAQTRPLTERLALQRRLILAQSGGASGSMQARPE